MNIFRKSARNQIEIFKKSARNQIDIFRKSARNQIDIFRKSSKISDPPLKKKEEKERHARFATAPLKPLYDQYLHFAVLKT